MKASSLMLSRTLDQLEAPRRRYDARTYLKQTTARVGVQRTRMLQRAAFPSAEAASYRAKDTFSSCCLD